MPNEDEASLSLVTQIGPVIDSLVTLADALTMRWRPGRYSLRPDDRLPSLISVALRGVGAWHFLCPRIRNLRRSRCSRPRAIPTYQVLTLPYALYPLIRCPDNGISGVWLSGPTNRNGESRARFRLWITDCRKRGPLPAIDARSRELGEPPFFVCLLSRRPPRHMPIESRIGHPCRLNAAWDWRMATSTQETQASSLVPLRSRSAASP